MQNWTIKDVKTYLYDKTSKRINPILTGVRVESAPDSFFEVSPLRDVRVNKLLLGKLNETTVYSTFKIKSMKKKFKLLLAGDTFYKYHYAFKLEIVAENDTLSKPIKFTMVCNDVEISDYHDDIIKIVMNSDCELLKKIK